METLWNEYAAHILECGGCMKGCKSKPNTREFYTPMCREGIELYKYWRERFMQ